MGSCNSSEEKVVVSFQSNRVEKQLSKIKETMSPKFRDMPEWEGYIY